MIADDADALAVTFHRMMRAALRAEQPGEDILGRTVELAGTWGRSPAADAELAVALRRLHGEEPDPDDSRRVAAPGRAAGPAAEESARGAAIGKFAANARRLREGEINPAEFRRIMDDDAGLAGA
ncbi:hypothetical protein [Micromonospora sp. DT47]|uniref:hypothetical protein n=1 Tax=Micromonospora sp. DT47 TaxID=3393431 RepID=UPI003CE8A245